MDKSQGLRLRSPCPMQSPGSPRSLLGIMEKSLQHSLAPAPVVATAAQLIFDLKIYFKVRVTWKEGETGERSLASMSRAAPA